MKRYRSPGYNYNFDDTTGFLARWGATFNDDPAWSPAGPEILDVEIATGNCSGRCPWCYKESPSMFGRYMDLATFRQIIEAMPSTLTQIALGITDGDANPDFIKIMEECRARGVVPNYTTAGYGMTNEIVIATARLCGAVAVSVYPHNEHRALDLVRRFVTLGMKQANIHLLYHHDNMPFVHRIIEQAASIGGLNAVVLLCLKPMGRGKDLIPATYNQFADALSLGFYKGVRMGLDSCSTPKFERWAREAHMDHLMVLAERCESSLFSAYVDVDGYAWPCSFAEGRGEIVPTPVGSDFTEAWMAMEPFRRRLLANGRRCPLYNLEEKDES